MKTILDDGHIWFLDSAVFNDQLTLVLVEGKTGKKEPLVVNDKKIADVNQIDVNEKSWRVEVVFKKIAAWQIVDESYTHFEKYEIRDDSREKPAFISILERSKYLDFVNENHGWYPVRIGPAKHIRVWAVDWVTDVVTSELPEIRSLGELFSE